VDELEGMLQAHPAIAASDSELRITRKRESHLCNLKDVSLLKKSLRFHSN
jgi:hypothetical protein